MRLVGEFETEKQAFAFSCFLHREGIDNIYEPASSAQGIESVYHIWVYDEDSFPAAVEWYAYYQAHPDDPKFKEVKPPPSPASYPTSDEFKIDEKGRTLKIVVRKKVSPLSYILTYFILGICIMLFLWNDLQEARIIKVHGTLALEVGLTPLQRTLLFDYPHSMELLDQLILSHSIKSIEELKKMPIAVQQAFKKAEATPYWKGALDLLIQKRKTGSVPDEPMFEKIRQGQFWRVFTPCLMHRDFLHILFNMAWLWILGRQIEERLKKGRMLLVVILIGSIANVAQYLISGPYFLGFSGVVVGMAGFIWSRQKVAPWEGYPLQKPTLLFILFFVLAMFVLEIVTLGLQLFSVTDLSPSIANTAHIIGGVVGIFLGRMRFFARRTS